MKNLIYYTVGLKQEYSELLKLSINKLDNSNSELYDILVITTKSYFDDNLSKIERKNIFFHFVEDFENSVDVSYSRLKIFDYKYISDYENILYIDTDVWVNLDLKPIFNQCIEDDQIYAAVEDYDFENHHRFPFSVTPYTEKDIIFFKEKNIHTFNSGVFMIKNSYVMEKHFMNIRMWFEKTQVFKWAEQPFMNQYFNTLNLVDTNVFIPNENFQYIFDGNINEKLKLTNKICHFIGDTFDGETKLKTIMNYKNNLNFNTRDELIENLSTLIPNGKGVEVGVYKGSFSKYILSKWGGTLYMVDVWRGLGDEYQDMSNHIYHSDAYLTTMENIQGYEDRGIMIRANSKIASEMFEDESLDFVYIDANHAYDFVVEDINLWFPKLKKGGIFSGHDYMRMDWYNDPNFCQNGKDKYIYTNTFEGESFYNGIFGVNPAVDEFCAKHNYKVNVTDEWFGTWWFRK